MKRIIFTVTNDLNYDQRMQRICNSLVYAGFDVLLVGRQKRKSLALTKQVFNQTRLNCFFEKGKLFYIEYNIRLFLFLLFAKCDIICAIDLDTILPCYFISKLRNKFCVYDAHEYFPEVPEVIERKFTRSVWIWVEKFTVPKVDLRYTVSDGLKRIFESKYNMPFYVIRNMPVLLELPAAEKKDRIIIYQGALNVGRGIEETIEAMRHIDAIFWVVGDGDITRELKGMAVRLELSDKVKFFGYMLPADLKKITVQATIGMNVWREGTGESYYYSLNNKVFDYIQACIPSVNMNYPEIKRLNDEYNFGVIIGACTPKEIADAVNNLLTNAELYNKLQKNCMETRLKLNWQNEEKKLVFLYQSIK